MQPVREAVGHFVDDDIGICCPVVIRSWTGPNVHLHPRPRTVGRGEEVSVVCSGRILSFRRYAIVSQTTPAKIFVLEVESCFGKSALIQLVMITIHHVE